MKSPGVTVRPIIMLDGGHEVNEVFFDNVEVPAENLIGEENKGWTYAKHLLSHERTNIADVNRAKRELERLKRIAKAEGVYDDQRFRDEIAKLEVDVVALEMLVLRVLSAEKSGKNPLDIAGLLKIKGSEIQQRYTELMMLAAGPYALPFIQRSDGSRLPGRLRRRRVRSRRWPPPTSTCARPPSTAAPTKCSATSLRRPCWAEETRHGFQFLRRPGTAARRRAQVGGPQLRLRAPPAASRKAGGFDRAAYGELAELGLTGLYVSEDHGGMGMGPVEAMVVMEELGRGIVLEPLAQTLVASGVLGALCAARRCKSQWLPKIASGEALVVLALPGAQGALPPRRRAKRRPRRPAAAGRSPATRASCPPATRPMPSWCPRMANGKIALFLVERDAQGVQHPRLPHAWTAPRGRSDVPATPRRRWSPTTA